jgi:hypothetical protein
MQYEKNPANPCQTTSVEYSGEPPEADLANAERRAQETENRRGAFKP